MIPRGFLLAFALTISCCTTTEDAKAFLRIKIDNHLAETRGLTAADAENFVTMEAYSYPSALKYFTDQEVLRVVRTTCDEHADLVRVRRLEPAELSIEWNFTGKGKSQGGGTTHGLPRFGATLTEQESGLLHIICGERVY